MTVDLHKWTFADRESLMALCNAVDRTFLSDRLPYPYTEADADWWLGMVAGNDGNCYRSFLRSSSSGRASRKASGISPRVL